MIELNYSPSDLKELYDAPRHFKALLYANIGFKLEQLAKEAEESNNKNK
ncbi:hypothetical protein [Oceanobacillus sp. CF4.6]